MTYLDKKARALADTLDVSETAVPMIKRHLEDVAAQQRKACRDAYYEPGGTDPDVAIMDATL